ncbi:serine/threonine-protein kinase, partial [Sorangium cellulosum]|uniref:serine/threonine-protein kinase n=1 Tax=Sorangium cellulosum TaxID=56 RepID=UPI001F2BADF7
LDKTHAAGIVHRDLKPENMFVTRRDDDSPCVKILDFGIAKVVEQSQKARTTQAVGTPLYMSPEQILGDREIGPRADLYSLGHIAYTLLVGEPYWAEEASLHEAIFPFLSTVLGGVVESPRYRALRRRGTSLPLAFDAWFRKATAPRPEDRFDRATTAVAALATALAMVPSNRSISSPDTFEVSQLPVPSDAHDDTVPLRDSAQRPPEPNNTVPLPTLVDAASRRQEPNSTVPLPTLHRAAHPSSQDRSAFLAPVSMTAARTRSSRVLPSVLGALLVVGVSWTGITVLRGGAPAGPEASPLPATTTLDAAATSSVSAIASAAPSSALSAAQDAPSTLSAPAEPLAPPTTSPRTPAPQTSAKPVSSAGRIVPRDAPKATSAPKPGLAKVDAPREVDAAASAKQERTTDAPPVTSTQVPPID